MDLQARIVPLQPVPAQRFKVLLASQQCEVFVYTRGENHLFMDLSVAGLPVSSGDICLHDVPLPSRPTPRFDGHIVFRDTSGRMEPPRWDALGSRWECLYLPGPALEGNV